MRPGRLNRRPAAPALGFALLGVALLGCDQPDSTVAEAGRRPMVAVSVLPQKYFVDRLAGDLVDTVTMVPAGANPATHRPTYAEMAAFERAVIYVMVGHPAFPFERAWIAGLLADRDDLTVVDSAVAVATLSGDPHLWLGPAEATAMVDRIAASLAVVLPDHEALIEQNRVELESDIAAAHDRSLRLLAPHAGGRFYVFHPAWGYLARTYGLAQVALEHEGKHPSAEELVAVVARARADGVAVLFTQPQHDPHIAEIVAADIGARIETIDPLAYDWLANHERVTRLLADSLGG